MSRPLLPFLHLRKPGLVFIASLDDVPDLCDRMKVGLLVSISDPERRDITRQRIGNVRTTVCPLDFHDIERPAPGLAVAEDHHLQTALTSARKVARHKPILVHCHAGVSRSSAVALVLAADRLVQAGKTSRDAISLAVDRMREAAPHARPNMRIIELGVSALNLGATDFVERAWDLHRGSLPRE